MSWLSCLWKSGFLIFFFLLFFFFFEASFIKFFGAKKRLVFVSFCNQLVICQRVFFSCQIFWANKLAHNFLFLRITNWLAMKILLTFLRILVLWLFCTLWANPILILKAENSKRFEFAWEMNMNVLCRYREIDSIQSEQRLLVMIYDGLLAWKTQL